MSFFLKREREKDKTKRTQNVCISNNNSLELFVVAVWSPWLNERMQWNDTWNEHQLTDLPDETFLVAFKCDEYKAVCFNSEENVLNDIYSKTLATIHNWKFHSESDPYRSNVLECTLFIFVRSIMQF